MRSRIVPRAAADDAGEEADDGCTDTEEAHAEEVDAGSVGRRVQRQRVPHRPGKRRRAVRRYYTWAELLRPVFRVEIFTCPNGGGARRLLAAIQDPEVIARVLRAVNARCRARRLPFDAPELAVARAPPDGGGGWLGA
jgi:hypothetical protein